MTVASECIGCWFLTQPRDLRNRRCSTCHLANVRYVCCCVYSAIVSGYWVWLLPSLQSHEMPFDVPVTSAFCILCCGFSCMFAAHEVSVAWKTWTAVGTCWQDSSIVLSRWHPAFCTVGHRHVCCTFGSSLWLDALVISVCSVEKLPLTWQQ